MTDAPANPESEAGRQDRRPLQFSIRSFFVAAVLVSLYLGAIKGLDGWLLFLVLAILSWLTWGGLLLRFRAARPLLALALAPVFLAMCWSYSAAIAAPLVSRFGPIVPVSAAFALSWGVIASLMIVLSLSVERLFRGRARRLRPGEPQEGGPRRQPIGSPRPARFVMLVVLTRVLISVAVFPAAFRRGDWVCWIAYYTNFAMDMPYVPDFVKDTSRPSTFQGSLLFVIITGICGAALYAILAAVVVAILGLLTKKLPSFAGPDLSSQ